MGRALWELRRGHNLLHIICIWRKEIHEHL